MKYETPEEYSELLKIKIESFGKTYEQGILVDIFLYFEYLMNSNQFEEISKFLFSLNMEHVSPQVIISTIRSSSAAKNKIPKWDEYVNNSKVWLSSNPLTVKHLLRGIL